MKFNHPRLLAGVILGALGFSAALWMHLPMQTAALVGWNLGAAVYLAIIWRLYVSASEADVRERAAQWDEPAGVIAMLVVAAIVISLSAVFASLTTSPGEHHARRVAELWLSAATLVSSWFVVQSLFVSHYAHRHFQAVSRYGEKAGFLFPGDPPSGYLDFAYLALCVGATAQVSDPGVQSRPLRNLVTAHAVAAFFYNTAVLALGVNILSGVIGH